MTTALIGGMPLRVSDNPDGSYSLSVAGQQQKGFAATIQSGQSLSDAVALGDLRAVRLIMPAAWTTAALTFQASLDGATFADLRDETGAEVSYTGVAGAAVRLPVSDWLGIAFLKIRSGTSVTPVNQGAARAFTIVAQ